MWAVTGDPEQPIRGVARASRHSASYDVIAGRLYHSRRHSRGHTTRHCGAVRIRREGITRDNPRFRHTSSTHSVTQSVGHFSVNIPASHDPVLVDEHVGC